MYNEILADCGNEAQSFCAHEKLYEHMSANGINCNQPIQFDGQIHRFSRDQKQIQKDEWYLAYEDISSKGNTYQVVVYGSWSDDSKFIYKSWEEQGNYFDEKEREELDRYLQKRQDEAAQAVAEQREQAAERADKLWREASPKAENEEQLKYASLKKITPYCTRFGTNPFGSPSLILPIKKISGAIRSLQFISVGENGTVYKTFLSGGEKKGNFMVMGEPKENDTILIAEGYATACTCHNATGYSTVVAFDCGNLAPVVEQLRQHYPNSKMIICADDDHSKAGNPGRSAALSAASEYNCSVAIPQFSEAHKKESLTDFNDLMQTAGIQEVKKQIEKAQPPLQIWLVEIKESPLDVQLRQHIYRLARQAVLKGNLAEKDFIIKELCKTLASHGITKNSIAKEFKRYLAENMKNKDGQDKRQITENERKIIDTLSEKFGPPIPMDALGEPEGINQLFFSNKYAHEKLILYEPYERTFYEYQPETGLWVAQSDDKVKVDLGHSFMRLINLLGFQELLPSRTEHLLRQLLNLLKGSIEQADAFQKKRGVIHVGNGVIHLKDNPDTLHEFSPEYYSRNRSEIFLNQETECPRFLDILLNPAMPVDDIELLQKYCGQTLLGYNPSQTILVISGTPGGGKSTLVSIIEKIIGLHNVAQLKVGLLSERFETASFVGKTLLTGKDVPGNFLNSQRGGSVLKALVGGDRLSIEQKHLKQRMEIRGEFNIIITSKARLHIRLDSDIGAWKRRLLLIEFGQPAPSKPIPHLDDVLIAEEGAGILNWMIEGAIKLLYDLETNGRIHLSKREEQRVDSLLAESDSIRSFVLNCIEPRHGSDVTTAELGEAYMTFCEDKGWRAVSITNFQNQIRDIILEVHRLSQRHDIIRYGKAQRGYMYVALKDQG